MISSSDEDVPETTKSQLDTSVASINSRLVPRQALNVLKERFGYTRFRGCQWSIIENVLQGRDQLAVMATGYGKSLCFQFPPVYSNGLTLCVSPLISLMEDQVIKLGQQNIGAEFLGSAQSNKSEAMRRVYNKEVSILYVTPEYCDNVQGQACAFCDF